MLNGFVSMTRCYPSNLRLNLKFYEHCTKVMDNTLYALCSDSNLQNAFASMPIKKRTMYNSCVLFIRRFIHGLQSYFFNNFLSYRIKTFGNKVIPGDLVYGMLSIRGPSCIENQEEAMNENEDNDVYSFRGNYALVL